MLKFVSSTNLTGRSLELDTEFVGLVVVREHVSAHLSAVVCEEDALGRLQLDAGHAAEPGPDKLGVAVLARTLATVEAHRVARVRSQVDAVVVLREGSRSLHRLNHPRVVKSIVTERGDSRADDGALR